MYEIRKRFRFEASHRLPLHDGKCARLHGHSWVAEVICSGYELHDKGPRTGMLMDFGDLSAAMRPLLDDHLDHYHLNDSLEMEHPTSEAVAKWIYDRLIDAKLPELQAVAVEETCTSKCVYYDERRGSFH